MMLGQKQVSQRLKSHACRLAESSSLQGRRPVHSEAHLSGVGGHEQGQHPGADTDAGYEEERKSPPLNSQYVRVSDAGGEEAAHHPAYAAIRLSHQNLLFSHFISADTLSNASLKPHMPAAKVLSGSV